MSNLKRFVRTVPDFPIPGIQFRDITSLCAGPGFKSTVSALNLAVTTHESTVVVGIESRGFVFGAPVAYNLDLPLVFARKPGKLPNPTVSKDYDLEYGKATLEIQTCEPIDAQSRVVIVDDLIATGGTAIACADLVHEQFGVPKENILILCVIDLPDLGGSTRAKEQGYDVKHVMQFEGE